MFEFVDWLGSLLSVVAVFCVLMPFFGLSVVLYAWCILPFFFNISLFTHKKIILGMLS